MLIGQSWPYNPAPTPFTSSVLDGYLRHWPSTMAHALGRTPFIFLLSPLMLDHPTGWPGTYIDQVLNISHRVSSAMFIPFSVVGASVNAHKMGRLLGTKGHQRCIWCPRRSGGKAGALEESLSH